jgi:hypothetical protein
MKKVLGFFILAMLTITLSACGSKKEEQTEAATDTTSVKTDTVPANTAEDTGVIGSIKDALTGSTTLKCNYTDDEGTTSTVHLKGNMVLIESITPGTEAIMVKGLVRDNKMYIWSDRSTDGFMIDFSKIKPEDSTMKMGQTQIHSSDDVVGELEKKKENCQKESLPDSSFEVPTGIKWPGGAA